MTSSSFLLIDYYFNLCCFYTTASASDIWLECDWQQESSDVKNFSPYSNRSRNCNNLYDFDSSFASLFFKPLETTRGAPRQLVSPSCSYSTTFWIPKFPSNIQIFVCLLTCFYFHILFFRNTKIHKIDYFLVN